MNLEGWPRGVAAIHCAPSCKVRGEEIHWILCTKSIPEMMYEVSQVDDVICITSVSLSPNRLLWLKVMTVRKIYCFLSEKVLWLLPYLCLENRLLPLWILTSWLRPLAFFSPHYYERSEALQCFILFLLPLLVYSWPGDAALQNKMLRYKDWCEIFIPTCYIFLISLCLVALWLVFLQYWSHRLSCVCV